MCFFSIGIIYIFIITCSALLLTHNTFTLQTVNRVCGLREFSQLPPNHGELAPTLMHGMSFAFWRLESHIGVGLEFSAFYAYSNFPFNDEKICLRFNLANHWQAVTGAEMHRNIRWANKYLVQITENMPDCVDFDIGVKSGYEKPIETSNNVQITDQLSDAKIVFTDDYGYKTSEYLISKYMMASKSPYFESKFSGRFQSEPTDEKKPFVVRCGKITEEVAQDFVTCIHQNKMPFQDDKDSMYDHMLKISTERLVRLLDLADRCQVDSITKPGELALLHKVEKSRSWYDFDKAYEYAMLHDNGSSELLEKLIAVRKTLRPRSDQYTKLIDKVIMKINE